MCVDYLLQWKSEVDLDQLNCLSCHLCSNNY